MPGVFAFGSLFQPDFPFWGGESESCCHSSISGWLRMFHSRLVLYLARHSVKACARLSRDAGAEVIEHRTNQSERVNSERGKLAVGVRRIKTIECAASSLLMSFLWPLQAPFMHEIFIRDLGPGSVISVWDASAHPCSFPPGGRFIYLPSSPCDSTSGSYRQEGSSWPPI